MNNGLGVDISQRSIQLFHSILTVKMILHSLRHTVDFLSASTYKVKLATNPTISSRLACWDA